MHTASEDGAGSLDGPGSVHDALLYESPDELALWDRIWTEVKAQGE